MRAAAVTAQFIQCGSCKTGIFSGLRGVYPFVLHTGCVSVYSDPILLLTSKEHNRNEVNLVAAEAVDNLSVSSGIV